MSRPAPPAPLGIEVTDSHCHLDITREGEQPYAVADALAAAAAVGVTRVVQVGCDVPSAHWAVRTAHDHPQVVAAVALHPNEAPRLAAVGELDAAYGEIERLAVDDRVYAIGETGLDFFRTAPAGRAAQEESFRRHIDLAARLGKTLVVHDRDAHADVLRVLDDQGIPDRVVMHCFSGDAAFARECADRGFFLSFAGTVTFANAGHLRDAVAAVALDHLLLETDAPFLAPTPHRGQPNASYLIPLTVRAMAAAAHVGEETLAAAIQRNTERAFGTW